VDDIAVRNIRRGGYATNYLPIRAYLELLKKSGFARLFSLKLIFVRE